MLSCFLLLFESYIELLLLLWGKIKVKLVPALPSISSPFYLRDGRSFLNSVERITNSCEDDGDVIYIEICWKKIDLHLFELIFTKYIFLMQWKFFSIGMGFEWCQIVIIEPLWLPVNLQDFLFPPTNSFPTTNINPMHYSEHIFSSPIFSTSYFQFSQPIFFLFNFFFVLSYISLKKISL